MTGNSRRDKIDDLLHAEKWLEARKLLEKELKTDPQHHWLMTQIGVTFYEQRRYKEAFERFQASRKIVSDCPLTLWNLAGTLDALGEFSRALTIYRWLLQTSKSPDDDPCWESQAWTEALKSDCVYRIGVCFQHLGKRQKARDCYAQYLHLLSIGMEGSYLIDDVKRQWQTLPSFSKPGGAQSEFRKAVKATLQISGIERRKERPATPLKINLRPPATSQRASQRQR